MLSFAIDSSCPRYVRADPLRLGQVLMNLISNGIKFTSRGSVELRVRCQQLGSQDSRLHFEVRDTGIGIPKEAVDKLFRSYTQADSSMSRRYGGTGLGLAICERLTELMGGQIGIDSVPGQGTNVWFTIALKYGSLGPGAFSSANSLAPHPSRSKRILIAEDNLVNQRVVMRLVEKLGYEVDVVSTGIAVIDAVKRSDYALILMDCEMPEMDGYETTRRIRAESSLGSDIPIIALTAHVSEVEGDAVWPSG